MSATILDDRFCHCCIVPIARAPAELWNRPGLSTLAYRIGTFGTFRAALLEDIAKQTELAGLTTRESDDYAITLLELFAAVGDVLTFYNERIVNELFLRTARERDSILRLVRLIGYRLNPGLAATAMLAFTLDDRELTRIRRGLKVMSIPGQDERPQTFETIEELLADARLNALPVYPPPVPLNALAQGNSSAPVIARPDPLNQGDRILIFGLGTVEEKTVTGIEHGGDGDRLTFSPAVQAPKLSPDVARAVKFVRRLRFFGHNAPESYQAYSTDPDTAPMLRWTTVTAGDPGYEVDFAKKYVSYYPLDTRYEDMKPGTQVLVDVGPGLKVNPRLRTAIVTATKDGPAALGQTLYAQPHLQDTVTHVGLRPTIRGRPFSALAIGPVRKAVARNGAGAVITLYPDFPGEPPRVLGEITASEDPAMIRVNPEGESERWEYFICDQEGRLKQMSPWTDEEEWEDRGGELTSRPVPLLLADKTLYVFARGAAGSVCVCAINPTLSAWESLEGDTTSVPAAVSWGGTRIDVFARGSDRALWWRSRAASTWNEWKSLGGTLATAPAAVAIPMNRIDVVALDDDGALIHRRWTGSSWTEWLNLAGSAKDEPAVIATGADRVEVFVRGDDDQLWQIARTGDTWGSWKPLGGTLASAPTVVFDSGHVHVCARSTDSTLVVRNYTSGSWDDWKSVGDGLGYIPDRRETRIYEIASPDIEFRTYDYPSAITGGRVAARMVDAPGLDGLDKGRRIMLDEGTGRFPARVTASRPVATTPGTPADHLLIDFDPPVPRRFRHAKLLGNLVEASHGETQPEEPLGNGDATKAFQKFRLRRAPLTYLQTETQIEGTAELEVRINGELWQEVPSLYGRRPRERIYTARQTDKGETELTFGDGRTGARVPTGAMNVNANYRTGLGLEGRVRAGQLAIPLERPVGLRSVTNPSRADGGADPETRDDARAAAPATVRTFGRMVSLRDFEWLAATSGLVARAKATWVWHKLEKTVHLTVAGSGGTPLSVDALTKLDSALRTARDPNRPLFLANLVRIPIVLRAKLLRETRFEADAVVAAARTALVEHFAFEHMAPGRTVHASDVYAVLQDAKGVRAVDVDLFHLKEHEDLTPVERDVRAVTAAPVQAHIRIFAARPTPADPSLIDRYALSGLTGTDLPTVLAAEQAYIDDPLADVELIVAEAL